MLCTVLAQWIATGTREAPALAHTRTRMCAELVMGYGGVGLWDKVLSHGGLARLEPCWYGSTVGDCVLEGLMWWWWRWWWDDFGQKSYV